MWNSSWKLLAPVTAKNSMAFLGHIVNKADAVPAMMCATLCQDGGHILGGEVDLADMTETAVQERVSLRECQWCCAPPGSTRDALPAVGLTEGKRESPVALMLRKWLSQRNPCR
ncbi:hypothetical protein CB1_001533049 [Camelus ferus]|nr:hypothetical protein CB1_001533049 [Camelus ferus]